MKRSLAVLLAPLSVIFAAGCAAEASPESSPSQEGISASTQEAWDAESATNEASSTHLWIVDHAVSLLAARTDLPRAAHFVQMLNTPACRTNWEQGLLDADFLAIYNNGIFNTKPNDSIATVAASGASFKSHFYDPDTNKNYKGETSPTARTQAAQFLAAAAANWAAHNTDTACYQLGLSFHYMTDSTQPMHAANFTNTNRAFTLHAHFESYAESIQSHYVVTDAAFLGGAQTADAALLAGAHAAKALWQPLLQSIYDTYKSRGWTCYAAYETWLIDDTGCWESSTAVDTQTGLSLQTAQRSTANYLYAAAALF